MPSPTEQRIRSTPGGQGAPAPRDPLSEARQICIEASPAIARRLVGIATSTRPPRNANAIIQAACKALAFAEGQQDAAAPQDVAGMVRLIREVRESDLERELERRKSS